MSDPSERGGYERCGADKKHGRGPCRLPAGHGTDHVGVGRCRRHGGNTPTHVAAAERVQAERIAETAVRLLGLDMTNITPSEALLREVRRSAAMVEFYALQVSALAVEDVVWGTTKRSQRTGAEAGTEVVQEARQNIWVVLLREERLVLAKVAAEAARAGVEERLARRAELEGAAMVQLIRAIFGDPEMGMRPEQLAAMATVVPRHLRAIAGGGS